MKVLVFGRVFPDSFTDNIATTLEAMGHEVVTSGDMSMNMGVGKLAMKRFRWVGYAEAIFPSLQKRWGEQLVALAGDFQPDFILVIEQPHPSVIRRARSACRAKIVYWMTDALPSFGRQYALASDYDASFYKDEYVVQFVRDKLGKRAYFLPQAFNPRWHRPMELTTEDRQRYGCDLAVAGNLYWYRALMLEPFIDYDVKIWGAMSPRWLDSPVKRFYQDHYVARQEKAKAYTAAKVVFNVMHYSEILGTNLRMFEAAGCGAFQVTDFRPNLHEVFEPGEEIVTFVTRQELKEKVDHYLAHDEERQAIAARGRARALRDHTYERRLDDIFRWTVDGHPVIDGGAAP